MKREGGAHRTTLSSFISLSKLISRIAVLGTPSSSASSRIFFSATIWFVSLFRERYCSQEGVLFQHRFGCARGWQREVEIENLRRRRMCLCFVERQERDAAQAGREKERERVVSQPCPGPTPRCLSRAPPPVQPVLDHV